MVISLPPVKSMNLASHLLIAVPCYFTYDDVSSFFLFFFPLFLFLRKFYLSRVHSRIDPEISMGISFFPPLDPCRQDVDPFNGNSRKFLCFLVPYPLSIAGDCFERRPYIDFPQSFPAPGGLSGKRIQIVEEGE